MAHILVTGAGGYIGTTLVPMLLARGHRVRVIDRFFFGRDLLQPHGDLEMIQEDSRRITAAHLADIDAVIDLVALSNDPSGELFQDATWAINADSRIRTAQLAREAGATRYILPSSCSIYGWQEEGVLCDEDRAINPLTTYAKANRKAEEGVLALSTDTFASVVLRQSTVYGWSPRMRFDLAINGMTYGAWRTGKLPLMRDGSQYRPMVHVRDTAAAQIFMVEFDEPSRINGQIFNVGSAAQNFQIGPLAELVGENVPRDVEIEWYGDPDHRSYATDFSKIESLGWKATHTAAEAVKELVAKLESGELVRDDRTITLKWYQELTRWHRIIHDTELHGGIVEIGPRA